MPPTCGGARASDLGTMWRSAAPEYSRFVAGDTERSRAGADELRLPAPVFALAVTILAAVTDPSSASNVVLAAIPVVAFGLWSLRPGAMPLVVLTLAVLAPVIVAQRSGALEPLFFDASLLAFVVGRWSLSLPTAATLGCVAALSPVAVALVQDPSEINVGIWILGIAFPWALGRALARQGKLAAELESTREELARQALRSERRGIARDIHDLVGHGLAAVMVQVTSARHVLRRDPAAAEEALRSAEEVGRRSMQELRRTLVLLRSEEDAGVAPPIPTAREIPALVDRSRDAGLAVELRVRGDLSQVPDGVGLALYRIAQEALANAARHAPRARTILGLELANGEVRLLAETSGSASSGPAADPERPRYGLIGMRERATALGGELSAGPTSNGWQVSCRLPLEPGAP
jgi:signal transduction histidine kinase